MNSADLCALIPHAGAMCLISELVAWDTEQIHCRAHSHEAAGHPLRSGGRLHGVHAVEYGAQAAAIHAGLLAREGATVPEAALLVGVSDLVLEVVRLDRLAGSLDIHASRALGLGANAIYAFRLAHAGRDLAAGRLSLVADRAPPR